MTAPSVQGDHLRTLRGVSMLLSALSAAARADDLEDADIQPGGFVLWLIDETTTIPLEETTRPPPSPWRKLGPRLN